MSEISAGSLFFIVITSIIGIFVISLGLRRKPSKGNNQYNLLHDVAKPNISIPKETISDFYKPSDPLSFPLSQLEIALLIICLKHVGNVNKSTDKQKLFTLIIKIATKFNPDSDAPYDSLVDFDSEETGLIDHALRLMMGDALIAQKFGGAADSYVDGRPISELAEHVVLMRDLLRRLDIGTEMQLLSYQISKLKRPV